MTSSQIKNLDNWIKEGPIKILKGITSNNSIIYSKRKFKLNYGESNLIISHTY